jgi:pimeloyl-ACP methyl ester carboxylesterase
LRGGRAGRDNPVRGQCRARRVARRVRGDRRRSPLVLLHGFFGDRSTWHAAGHVGALAGRFRLILIDLVGHGGSDAPPDPARYRMDEHARDVVAVLDSLGVDRAAAWGASMGGRVGFHLMARSPGRLAALIAGGAHACAVETYPAELERETALLREQGTAPFADAIEPGWMREVMLRADGHALAARALADAAEQGAPPELDSAPVPVLLLAGEHDPRLHLIRSTGDRLSRAEVAVLPGCGHFGTFTRTDLTVPLAREFPGRPRP